MGKTKLALILMSTISGLVAIAVLFLSLSLSGALPGFKNTITLSSATYSKVYDGTAASKEECKITSGKLYDGHRLEVLSVNSGCDVDTYDNSFEVRIVNSVGVDVTSSYNIKTNYGKITITPRLITIKAVDQTAPYDGKKLTTSEYEAIDLNLAAGERLEVFYQGEITDVGDEKASIIPHIYTADDKEVTSNYKITALDGTLVKTPIILTLTSKTDEKTYDGKPLTDDSTEPFAMEGALIEGDTLTYSSITSITDAGETENKFIASISDGTKDVTYRYTIRPYYGKLTVNQLSVSFQSKDHLDCLYNGKAFDFTDEELASQSDIPETDELKITFTGKYINADTYSNKFFVSITSKDEEKRDVSSNYKISMSYGTILISQLPIELRTISATKTYDGSISGGWDSKNGIIQSYSIIGELAEGDNPQVSFQKISANAGTYRNIASVKISNSLLQNVSSNYDITYSYGDLVIQQRSITVQASSAFKEYDGHPLTSSDWYWVSGSTTDGEHLTVETVGSQTKVGASINTIKWRITNDDGVELSNAANNYHVEIIPGKLMIYAAEKQMVYIAPMDNIMSKADFDALGTGKMTSTGVLGFEEYALDGYSLNVVFDKELTGVGTAVVGISSWSVTKDMGHGPEDVSNMFDVDCGTGLLRVYLEEFEIETASDTKAYDGTALTNAEITVGGVSSDTGTVSFTQNGKNYVLQYTNSSEQTTVGQSLNRITITGLSIDSVPVAAEVVNTNYYFKMSLGTLEVTRKKIEVTTATKTLSKSADGVTSVSASDVAEQIFDPSGLAPGDELYIKKSFTLSTVDSSAENKIEIGVKNSTGDVSDNYIIIYTYGVLTLNS